jgi:hypothetical protein
LTYQPWFKNCTYPALQIPLFVEGTADDITNVNVANFIMTLHPNTGSDAPGTGTFTKVTNNPAVVSYKFSHADVAAVFTGNLVVSAYFPPSNTNADEAVWEPIPFNISDD